MQHISRWRANPFEPVAICRHSTVAEALSPASCVSCEPAREKETDRERERRDHVWERESERGSPSGASVSVWASAKKHGHSLTKQVT